jgi:hypothetical protein
MLMKVQVDTATALTEETLGPLTRLGALSTHAALLSQACLCASIENRAPLTLLNRGVRDGLFGKVEFES